MLIAKKEIDNFMAKLKAVIERFITQIILIPLFGQSHEFNNIDDALRGLNSIDIDNPAGKFKKFEIIIDYNNGDTVRATFQNKVLLADFLTKL